ncbi:MAG: hypothetical protein K2X43_06125 [Hyphomonadaceae bacterium]|nr:hypothetical protein [Hyphomonadaceae bacterium]
MASMIVLAAATAPGAASVRWDTRGTFEACLEQRLNDWINAKAALVLNEDPAAAEIDDMDVALWAVAALQGCEEEVGRGNQTSEQRFSQHMAHWREHIYSVAQSVRQRVRAD